MTNDLPLEGQPVNGPSGEWLTSLDGAIQSGEVQTVQQPLAYRANRIEAHHKLATQPARLTYVVDNTTRFPEMIVVPGIDRPSPRWRKTTLLPGSSYSIGEAQEGCLASKERKTAPGQPCSRTCTPSGPARMLRWVSPSGRRFRGGCP